MRSLDPKKDSSNDNKGKKISASGKVQGAFFLSRCDETQRNQSRFHQNCFARFKSRNLTLNFKLRERFLLKGDALLSRLDQTKKDSVKTLLSAPWLAILIIRASDKIGDHLVKMKWFFLPRKRTFSTSVLR